MKYFSFAFLVLLFIAVESKTLLDIEIETTKELIELYQRKADLISKMNTTEGVSTNKVEEAISKQERFLTKKRVNMTEMIGFEDPFKESPHYVSSVSDNQKEYEKHRDRLESLFHERILFDENGRNITQHQIMNIKPLTRSSSGGYMVQGVLLGLDNIDIHVYDVYKNLLVNMSMAEYGGIKLLKGSNHNEDMYIVAISPDNHLCEFNIELINTFNKRKEEQNTRNPKGILHPINETKSKETGREDLFNKNYKRMLSLYKYYVENSKCVNLNEFMNTTNVNYNHIEFYMNRGIKYYILGDDQGYVNIIEKGLENRYRIYSGEDEIIQIVKHSLTLMIVNKHDIRFIKFFKREISSIRCHSGISELKSIVVDTNHNGFVYGISADGDILMFKTEKLVNNNVDNIKCNLQGKLKVNLPKDGGKEISLSSLTNYLIALKSDGNLEIFDMTNINDFFANPISYSIKLPFTTYSEILPSTPALRSIKSFNGNLFLVNFLTPTNSKLALYECLTPVKRETNEGELFNFKFPIFFIAFAVVLVFQFANRKEGEDNDIISILLGCCGMRKRGKIFRNKKEKEMHELEKLVTQFTKRNTDAMDKIGGDKLGG
ncbi:unnamed protein product [Moneuplotes crassus]|uniref:Uncharacterized protein n=1 Tax=Euplotes crassus TaxID=5936 RepID=A0AAD1U5S2_EUPCR|nr:unnamed protein product [Moneuplotes crassus]